MSDMIARGQIKASSDKFQKDFDDRMVNIKKFESMKVAVAEGYDWTPVFNYALSLFVGVKVWVPIGEYLIKGEVTVPKFASIVGDRVGLTQGIGSDLTQGGNRVQKITEAVFKIKPSDITKTPFTMQAQSVIKGVAFIYPDQNPANTSEANVIKYAYTITGVSGSCVENVRMWGAYNFIYVEGESPTLKDIYGYALGSGIYVKGAADVARLENIHLNPNVARPVQDFIPLSKSRADSVAFTFDDCDGVHINNVHAWSYRTSLRVKGGSGATQCNITLNNFFFDLTGVAFDIDTDSNWGVQINNGVCVVGFSDNADYAGFLNLNKTVSQNFFTPVQVNNVSVVRAESYGSLIPNYLVNFKFQYLFDLRFTNVSYDNFAPFISPHKSYVEGKVRSANYYMDLEKDYQRPNWLSNVDMKVDRNGDGVPDNWVMDVGTRNLTVSKDITGFTALSTSDGMQGTFKGIYQRIILPQASNFRVMVKARVFDSTSAVYVRAYDSGYSNMIEKTVNFDANGYAIASFSNATTEKKLIVDVMICPSLNAGGYLHLEKAQLVTDTRGYMLASTSDAGVIAKAPTSLKKTATPTNGISDAYGAVSTVSPATGLIGIELKKIKIAWTGTFNATETHTVKIQANYNDGTNAFIEKAATAVSSLWLTDDEILSLIKDGTYITSISTYAKTSLATSSVSKTITVLGTSQ